MDCSAERLTERSRRSFAEDKFICPWTDTSKGREIVGADAPIGL